MQQDDCHPGLRAVEKFHKIVRKGLNAQSAIHDVREGWFYCQVPGIRDLSRHCREAISPGSFRGIIWVFAKNVAMLAGLYLLLPLFRALEESLRFYD